MSSGIAQTAAEWMAKLRGGRTTPGDHAAYREWLDASAEHRDAARALNRMWNALGVLDGDPLVQYILKWRLGDVGRSPVF